MICIVLLVYTCGHGTNFLIRFENGKSIESDVLLIYVYAESHPYALANLNYFIETAVRNTDPVDYYFILQQTNHRNINESKLPKLPNNARYVHHENECYDYGTVGWFISHFTHGNPMDSKPLPKDTRKIDLRKYKYFIFLNSSTRGPFFPPYYLNLVSLYESRLGKKYFWYSIFTERITDTVKLVGPVISCEVSTHIQSYFITTDSIGLSIGLKSQGKHGVFDCHTTLEETITYAEIGFTKRILAAGYMIDCLMTKYQNLNFNSQKNRNCNSKTNPHLNNGIDGISLDPYEIVFIKFTYKRNDGIAADRALIYQKWVRELQNNTAKHSKK
ncbi:unnamed protein product [Rotaria socialis]|nr:unnamed protein product [Rotaria socialis]